MELYSPPLHALLLLSDSALPLGSFAFSSGLESYLAHCKQAKTSKTPSVLFDHFLDLSLANLASTTLPYVMSAYHHPDRLADLDNDLDASTPCTVARRASVAQGRALIAVWERALAPSAVSLDSSAASVQVLQDFVSQMKNTKPDEYGLQLNAHFAPLFGIVCLALQVSPADTAYLYLLNHAKALLSAAVRASVMGPYQSHAVLASASLQRQITLCVAREKEKLAEAAGLTVPTMDLWIGRHELLYSRIFNS